MKIELGKIVGAIKDGKIYQHCMHDSQTMGMTNKQVRYACDDCGATIFPVIANNGSIYWMNQLELNSLIEVYPHQ